MSVEIGVVAGSIIFCIYTRKIILDVKKWKEQNEINKEKRRLIYKMIDEHRERSKELRKNYKKERFITNLIDEIPILSYYEAKQLNKKLAKIYTEWNDE